MDKKLTPDEISASYSAIKRYVEYRKENRERHRAHVLISSRINPFNDILYIYAELTSKNDAIVIIEGDDIYARDFMPEYTNKTNHFKFINGTLLIKSKDIWGNDIQVDIASI